MIKLKPLQAINRFKNVLIKRTDKVALFSVNVGQYYNVTRIYVLLKAYDHYGFITYQNVKLSQTIISSKKTGVSNSTTNKML
jgi:hypothetical protein